MTDGQTPLQGRYRHPKKRNKILIRFAKIVTSNVFRLFRPVLYFLPFSFHQNLQSFQRQKPGRSAILKTICTQTHTLSWWAAEGWGPRLHAIRFPAQFPRHLLVFDPYQDSIPTIAPWCLGRPTAEGNPTRVASSPEKTFWKSVTPTGSSLFIWF